MSDQALLARQAEALKNSRQESALRAAQLVARIHSLPETEALKEQANLQMEMDLYEALWAGINQPSVRLDVVGFVMLSRQTYALFTGEEEEVAA